MSAKQFLKTIIRPAKILTHSLLALFSLLTQRENKQLLKSRGWAGELVFKLYCHIENFEKSNPDNNGEFKYLYKILSRATKNKQDNLTLFDIGSHHGEFIETILNDSNKLSLKTTIHSFEPMAENFLILSDKFSQFKNINLNNLAIDTQAGKNMMYANFSTSEGASFYPRKNLTLIDNPFNYQEKVKTTRLDSYLEQQKINNIYYLKIDTEGYELAVLQSLDKYLKPEIIQHIHFEWNPDFGHKLADIYELLSKHGYHIYQITAQGNLYHRPYELRLEKFFANYAACAMDKKFINFSK